MCAEAIVVAVAPPDGDRDGVAVGAALTLDLLSVDMSPRRKGRAQDMRGGKCCCWEGSINRSRDSERDREREREITHVKALRLGHL